MARLDDLVDLREGLLVRLAGERSGQNYAVLGRLLVDVVKQIDELDPAPAEPKETTLSEFEKRLRDREQRAKAPRRAKGV